MVECFAVSLRVTMFSVPITYGAQVAKASIHTVAGRSRLDPKREPYWVQLGAGRYVGFRKLADGPGTWIARLRDVAAARYLFNSFGDLAGVPDCDRFTVAKGKAEAWFSHIARGGSTTAGTVSQACSEYVAHVRREKGEKAAADLAGRYLRWIDEDPIGGIALKEATRGHFLSWVTRVRAAPLVSRKGAKKGARLSTGNAGDGAKVRSVATSNRDIAAVRAALNHAQDEGWVADSSAWDKPMRDMEGAQEVRPGGARRYIAPAERRKILNASAEDFSRFLQVLNWLPLRPGALAAINVDGLDTTHKSLQVGWDKRHEPRVIPLPSAIYEFLAECAKGRNGGDPLLSRADGSRWDKDAWAHEMERAVTGAGLDHAALYAIRHSVLTDLLTSGADGLTVARLAGTSMEMLQATYGHLTAKAAVSALEKMTRI